MESRNSALYKAITIGGREIPGNVVLAPMAGYTDAAFRFVCMEQGASLCFTEMASAEALSRGSGKTLQMLDAAENEHQRAVQIFVATASRAAAAVRALKPLAPMIIDLNCGCSVPKVLKTGCGAGLLKDPGLIAEIVRAMRQETDAAVTVKLRSGWDAASITYRACAEAAVKEGAAMVALHPRFRSQGFSGTPRWEEISLLKRECPVPVFGSGNLFSPEDCLRMMRQTGCDGVMIARGALGNPFIFRHTRALLLGGETPAVLPDEVRLRTAMTHLRHLSRIKGEEVACREMRKHFVAYTRGMTGGAELRRSIVRAATIASYEKIVGAHLGHPV